MSCRYIDCSMLFYELIKGVTCGYCLQVMPFCVQTAIFTTSKGKKMIGAFLLQIVLIFCNAIFACAEIAVISMNDTKLKLLSQEGDHRAKKLLSLTDQPAKFLSTIQVAHYAGRPVGRRFCCRKLCRTSGNAACSHRNPYSQKRTAFDIRHSHYAGADLLPDCLRRTGSQETGYEKNRTSCSGSLRAFISDS